MASLAAELQSLADLKAKGVLTEDEFTHAKAAVIAGDADAPIDRRHIRTTRAGEKGQGCQGSTVAPSVGAE